jgi:uncharacterized protein YuzE
VRIDYDLDAHALYVTITADPVASTVAIDDGTNVDLDQAGGIVGIEVVDYAKPWPLEQILAAYRVSPPHAACLRAVQAAGWRAPEVTVSSPRLLH